MNNILNNKNINKNLILLRKHINLNTIIIIILVLYISCLSIYTPRHVVALINHPMSKLIILGLIMYYGKDNLLLGLFMALALLVTINLDNSLSIAEHKLRENFYSESKEDEEDVGEEDEEEDEEEDNKKEEDDDDDEEDENYEPKTTLKAKDNNDSDNSDDDDDSDDDSDDDDDDSDDEEEEEEEETFKSFDKTKLKPSKNVKDSFSKLHNAIHDLQNMVKKSKKS